MILPVVDLDGADHILFGKRTERPGDPYSGQICFPGGAQESGDATLADCALREAEEELGIRPADVEIFAELGWRRTMIHHHIKPYAGHVRPFRGAVPNGAEIDGVLFLHVDELRPELFEVRETRLDAEGKEHEIYRFDLGGHEVWGLTARILRDFYLESEDFRRGIGR